MIRAAASSPFRPGMVISSRITSGPVFPDQIQDLAAVRFAHHLDARQSLQQGTNAGAHQNVIVGEDDPEGFLRRAHAASPGSGVAGRFKGNQAWTSVPRTWSGLEFQSAPGERHPFLHAQQPQTGPAHCSFPDLGDIESDAVVANAQVEAFLPEAQFHVHGACAGMPHDVGQGFLGHPEALGLEDRIEALFQGIRTRTRLAGRPLPSADRCTIAAPAPTPDRPAWTGADSGHVLHLREHTLHHRQGFGQSGASRPAAGPRNAACRFIGPPSGTDRSRRGVRARAFGAPSPAPPPTSGTESGACAHRTRLARRRACAR